MNPDRGPELDAEVDLDYAPITSFHRLMVLSEQYRTALTVAHG